MSSQLRNEGNAQFVLIASRPVNLGCASGVYAEVESSGKNRNLDFVGKIQIQEKNFDYARGGTLRRMKVPTANLAIVPEAKITRYLLNSAHPAGGSKAAFFQRHGFRAECWQQLAGALVRHAVENEVIETETTRHGDRYAVDGPMIAPDGKLLNIRSVWYIYPGSERPRLVTAHPLPKT